MAIIKIQFNKQIRKFNDAQNIQLNKIYNFIMKHFDNLPPYFELQFRDPLNKIKRQLMNNDQLQNLIQMKQNITLIIKPIIFENIGRYQICKKKNEQFQSTGIFSDMALLLERLSLHQSYSENQFEKENNTVINNSGKNIINKFLVEDCNEQETNKKEESYQLTSAGVNNNYCQNIVIQDEKDFLIKDETKEYVEQMFCLSSDDDSSQQIELDF